MELRVLKYFLAVAEQGTVTGAAQRLHLTQPTLTRQIHDLERELGQTLLVRHSHSVSLTREGELLRERALQLVELAEKTEAEMRSLSSDVSGDIYLGAAETWESYIVGRALTAMREKHPNVVMHVISGNAEDLCGRLDQGILDFALLSQPLNLSKYETLPFPRPNYWCAYTHKDNPLAQLDVVTPADLAGKPLIVSSQSMHPTPGNQFRDWFGDLISQVWIVADFNLPFNAAVLASQKLGTLITWNDIVDVSGHSRLRCVPLSPRVESNLALAWRKKATLSQVASLFLDFVREQVECESMRR